jgi:hypothetical protein
MRFRMENHRGDTTRYAARHQELPAVYTIAALHRWMAYVGDRPFTGGALTHIANDWRKPWPWTRTIPTERWAALVGDDDWGIGMLSEDGGHFDGGLFGQPGSHDPLSSDTAYMAPTQVETIDHDIVYRFHATLMVGTLADMRARFTALAAPGLPAWTFAEDRQHWHCEGGADAGVPRDGAWRVPFGAQGPRLVGPVRCWRAEDAGAVAFTATSSAPLRVRIAWRRLGEEAWDPDVGVEVALIGDGRPHSYQAALAGERYQGLLTGLAVTLAATAGDGVLALQRIALVAR